MRSASFLVVATSLAVAQAAAIKRTPFTERNLEELVTRQATAFRGGKCQTECAAWFQSLGVCQASSAGNWQQLGNCLCQPEARAAIPDCLKCVDDDGDSVDNDDNKSEADYDDLSDLDSIANESDLEDALEDVAGVCIRYHGASASSLLPTPTPANAAPFAQPTLTRTKSSDSLDHKHDDKHDDDDSDDEHDDGNDSDDDD